METSSPSTLEVNRVIQVGGLELGRGGFGSVHTLHDLTDAPGLQLLSVDMRRGDLVIEPASKADLVRRYANVMVYKTMMRDEDEDEDEERGRRPPPADSLLGARRRVLSARAGGRHFLADVMRRWGAPPGLQREERAKWELLSAVTYRGVRMPPVQTLMPLHRAGDLVFLALRTRDGEVYPLYRYMHGSLREFAELYTATPVHVLRAARAMLDCLSMLLLYGGIHHNDIKPENVLFRVRGVRASATQPPPNVFDARGAHAVVAQLVRTTNPGVDFVLADYGGAVARPRPEDVAAQASRGTRGYRSPATFPAARRDAFLAEFERARRPGPRAYIAPQGPALPTGEQVWASYAPTHEARERGELDPTLALMKNDLYGVGMTLLAFPFPFAARELQQVGVRLLLGPGADGALLRIADAQAALDAAEAALLARGALHMRLVRTQSLRSQAPDQAQAQDRAQDRARAQAQDRAQDQAQDRARAQAPRPRPPTPFFPAFFPRKSRRPRVPV